MPKNPLFYILEIHYYVEKYLLEQTDDSLQGARGNDDDVNCTLHGTLRELVALVFFKFMIIVCISIQLICWS